MNVNKINKNSSQLISVIDKDIKLKDWILREIVLRKIRFNISKVDNIPDNLIKNYVEYENNDDKAKLVPLIKRSSFCIYSSLSFVMDNLKNEEGDIDSTNINHEKSLNNNKLSRTIFLKTLSMENNDGMEVLAQNIRKSWNLGFNNSVKELHIYCIINNKVQPNLIRDNELLCDDNKIIYTHLLSSNYFFNADYLDSFCKFPDKKAFKDLSVSNVSELGFRGETSTRMNIFIFKGLELGIIRMYFQFFGYTLNGGATSLRHVLSQVGFRLSKFLIWSGLGDSIESFDSQDQYFERYIDEKTFANEILGNYKSGINRVNSPNILDEYPAEFVDLYTKKYYGEDKLFYLLIDFLKLCVKIIKIENDIKIIDMGLVLLMKYGCEHIEFYDNYLKSIDDNLMEYRLSDKGDNILKETLTNIFMQPNHSLQNRNNNFISGFETLITKLNISLNTLLKNKIKCMINIYAITNWNRYLESLVRDTAKINYLSKNYPDFQVQINEVKIFYQELVNYIPTLDLKGKIKTSARHVSHKVLSKEIKKISGKDKKHLHTLIKNSNKNVCKNGFVGHHRSYTVNTYKGITFSALSKKEGYIIKNLYHSSSKRYANEVNNSSSTNNSSALILNDGTKINKLGTRISNIKSIYNYTSPVFKELFFTLNKKLYSTDVGNGSGSEYLLAPSPEEEAGLTTKNSASQTQKTNLTQTQAPLALGALPQQPIMSLRDIIEYKEGLVERSPYQGLLKNKENTKFKYGKNILYPNPNEYSKFKDICDWKFRITQIINEVLIPGQTYDIAVIGRNILNEDYITYGKHFLINSESNIDAVITRIEGNIFVNSASLNSGEYSVAENDDDLEVGFRLIVFRLRPVTFDLIVHKAANKVLLDNTRQCPNKGILACAEKNFNKKELFDNVTASVRGAIKALLKSLPNSNLINNYGILINNHHTDISGIIGALYQYKNKKILLYNTKIKEEVVLQTEGIVYKNNQEYFKFTDRNLESNAFLRIIGNTTIKYENNKIIYIDSKINSKKVEPLKFEIVRNMKYGSFDIETALDINNKFIPVSCGWKIKKKYKHYFIGDYDSAESMFKHCFEDMLDLKNYTWYAHNLGGFDAVFILKILLKNYPKTKVQFKDNKPIWIKVPRTTINNKTNKEETNRIVFKDSYKLLPLSIRNLIKALAITTQKLYFPYRFMNIDNLNYEGKIPEKSYFENISDLDYKILVNEFKDKNWNLKAELLKYMENDIVALYQIIDQFSLIMFELENLNITSVSTISSNALKIYLSNYYNNNITPIHIPRYVNYQEIKNAYFGGRVEVFKGYVENIYIYDVVSLYPACMLNFLPIGCISKSTDSNLDNYFGFCFVSVNVPKGIRAPILPFRLDNGGLIHPTGNWSGWYTSEILKKARDDQNVSIEVHYGYKMEKSNLLFKKFVDKYTQLKINAEKEGNNALRTIIKLILNSLYGRFGLKYEPYSIDFVNSSKANDISINHEVFERLTIDIDKDIEYIKYTTIPSDILKEINRDEYNKLKNKTDLDAGYVVRNLTIAAMITSHGSILMNPFLNNPNNPCYYTDTDSLFLKYPLDEKYVGTELGKFSFKGKVKRAYFISPKTYCLIMEDDTVIIKSKGLNNNLLNEEHFKELISGHNIEIDTSKIFTNIKKGSGGIKPMTLTIKAEINNRKFINGEGLEYDSIPYHVIDGVVECCAPPD